MKLHFSFVSMIFSFALLGCGASPLFNHENAKITRDEKLSPSADFQCELHYPELQLCGKLEWIKGPVLANENRFSLKFWNSDTGSFEGPWVDPPGRLEIVLWRPSIGHPPLCPVCRASNVEIVRRKSGSFKVSKVFFSSSEVWDIQVNFLDSSGDDLGMATHSLFVK